jgi:hypothetical protein
LRDAEPFTPAEAERLRLIKANPDATKSEIGRDYYRRKRDGDDPGRAARVKPRSPLPEPMLA